MIQVVVACLTQVIRHVTRIHVQQDLQEELKTHLRAVRKALDSEDGSGSDPYDVEASKALYQKVVRLCVLVQFSHHTDSWIR